MEVKRGLLQDSSVSGMGGERMWRSAWVRTGLYSIWYWGREGHMERFWGLQLEVQNERGVNWGTSKNLLGF